MKYNSFESKPLAGWYNFITDEYDYRSSAPDTDEEAIKYIPNQDAARGLYRAYRAMGNNILDSMIYVLEKYARYG